MTHLREMHFLRKNFLVIDKNAFARQFKKILSLTSID